MAHANDVPAATAVTPPDLNCGTRTGMPKSDVPLGLEAVAEAAARVVAPAGEGAVHDGADQLVADAHGGRAAGDQLRGDRHGALAEADGVVGGGAGEATVGVVAPAVDLTGRGRRAARTDADGDVGGDAGIGGGRTAAGEARDLGAGAGAGFGERPTDDAGGAGLTAAGLHGRVAVAAGVAAVQADAVPVDARDERAARGACDRPRRQRDETRAH